MAIRLSYGPPAAVVGEAAYLGGLGQFNQQQQQFQLQAAELAQRDMAQQRALAAQQQSQMFGAHQDAIDRQFRAGMLGQQQQFEAGQFDQRLAAQAGLAAEEDRRAFIMERYKNKEWRLDDAGRRKLHDITNRSSEIRSDARLTPTERSRALAKLDEDYWGVLNNPAPMIPGEEEVPWAEEAKSLTTMEPVFTPEGDFMGYNHISKHIRNDGVAPQVKFIPHKPADATANAKLGLAEDKSILEREKAQQAKVEAEKKAYSDMLIKWQTATKKTSKPDPNDKASSITVEEPYGDQEILDKIKQHDELMAKRFGGQQQPAPPPQITVPPDTVVGQLERAGAVNANPLVQEPPQEPMPEPMTGPDRFAPPPNHGYPPEPVRPTPPVMNPNAAPPGPPGQLRPFTPEEVATYVQVPSLAEAASLPPGTRFVTADGQVGEVE